VGRDREPEHGERPEHDVHRDRHPHEPALGPALQPRRGPQRRERREREHQDRGGRRVEERLGDRQVGAADDAVGEDQHGGRV